MLRLILDLDNVIVDLSEDVCRYFNGRTGKDLQPQDLTEYDFWKNYGLEENKGKWYFLCMANTRGFWENLSPVKGALLRTERLAEKYDIYLATTPTHTYNCYYEKADWVKVHLPFLGQEKLIFAYNKGVLSGDIMVDDYLPHLAKFQGKKILFTQPYNKNIPFQGYRVDSWKELEETLSGAL